MMRGLLPRRVDLSRLDRLSLLPEHPSQQGGGWPDSAQIQLLRACLLSGPEAGEAWNVWRRWRDLDQVDAASFRMLPLLYQNLVRQAPDAAELPRLKGIYRYFWARHQKILHQTRPVVGALRNADIPVLLTKGAALNFGAYAGRSIRPMDDLDVVVPFTRAREAQDVVERAGWKSIFRHPDRLVEIAHACHYEGPERAPLDLHWHVLHSDCSAAADALFWGRTIEASWEGESVRILHPADQLLHLCEHGVRYNLVAPLRWLADVALVLDAGWKNCDWEVLVVTAEKKDLTLPVQATLLYLQEHLNGEIPAEVFAALARVRPTLLARAHQVALAWPTPRGIHFWNQLPANLLGYLRLKRSDGYRRLWCDAASYLEVIHDLDRPLDAFVRHELRMLGTHLLDRLRALWPGSGSVLWQAGKTGAGVTWDAYGAEPYGGHFFCWCKPKASFRLPASARGRILEVELPPIPELWSDLQGRGLQAFIDGVPTELEVSGEDGTCLRTTLVSREKQSGAGMVFQLRVEHPLRVDGDARLLGFPLRALRLVD
jgi:hypothetical protein